MEVHDLQNVADDEAMRENERTRRRRRLSFFQIARSFRRNRQSNPRAVRSAITKTLENFRVPMGGLSFLGSRAIPIRSLLIGKSIGRPRLATNRRPIAKCISGLFPRMAAEETRMTVEPFAGNHCIAVSQARSTYRIELGYHEPADVWHSVATSDAIATPPADVSENDSIDVATIPFHLSFQRMVDTFRASRYDGDALVEIVGRLQERADDPRK